MRARKVLSVGSGLLTLCLILLATGCVKESAPRQLRPVQGGVAPTLVVERFLNAVNSNDLETMARLFGTREGSILDRDSRTDIETWMYALASILRHKDYLVEGEEIVPGRIGEAVELRVRMDVDDRQVMVPFVVVRTRTDRWLIERIGVERITAGRD